MIRGYDVHGENVWQGVIDAVRPIQYLVLLSQASFYKSFVETFFREIAEHLCSDPFEHHFSVPHAVHGEARYIGDCGMILPLVGGWQHETAYRGELYGKRLDDLLYGKTPQAVLMSAEVTRDEQGASSSHPFTYRKDFALISLL